MLVRVRKLFLRDDADRRAAVLLCAPARGFHDAAKAAAYQDRSGTRNFLADFVCRLACNVRAPVLVVAYYRDLYLAHTCEQVAAEL